MSGIIKKSQYNYSFVFLLHILSEAIHRFLIPHPRKHWQKHSRKSLNLTATNICNHWQSVLRNFCSFNKMLIFLLDRTNKSEQIKTRVGKYKMEVQCEHIGFA